MNQELAISLFLNLVLCSLNLFLYIHFSEAAADNTKQDSTPEETTDMAIDDNAVTVEIKDSEKDNTELETSDSIITEKGNFLTRIKSLQYEKS